MRTAAMILMAAAMTGCIRTTTDPVTGRVDVDIESPTQRGQEWNARIGGQAIASISGTAVARVHDGQTQVTVNLTGVPAGDARPWHVHDGKCNSGGGIVGSASAYPPLTVGADGRATGNATLQLQLDEARDYHVNVHASAAQMGTIVACGDLSDR